jgi:hypothetical protein
LREYFKKRAKKQKRRTLLRSPDDRYQLIIIDNKSFSHANKHQNEYINIQTILR